MPYPIRSKLFVFLFAIFLLLYFLYAVVSTAPAAWAAWGLHQAVPNLWLSSVEGSLWRGKARSAQVDLGPAPMALGEVRWSISPLSLLSLRPCLNFSAELPGQSFSGRLCQNLLSDQSRVSDVNLDAPISALQDILPIDATGFVSIIVREARFTSKAEVLSLDGQFSWENALANTGDSWIKLGSFAATAKENGKGGVVAEVFDIQGPYRSQLNAEWSAGQDWRIAGTIAPQAGAADLVVQGLQVLGEDLGSGVYRVQWP